MSFLSYSSFNADPQLSPIRTWLVGKFPWLAFRQDGIIFFSRIVLTGQIALGWLWGHAAEEKGGEFTLGLLFFKLGILFPKKVVSKTKGFLLGIKSMRGSRYLVLWTNILDTVIRMPWDKFTVQSQYLSISEEWKVGQSYKDEEDMAWIEVPYSYVVRGDYVQTTVATVRRTRSLEKWQWFDGVAGYSKHPVAVWLRKISGQLRKKQPIMSFTDYLEIRFKDEMGTMRGSWKGGAIGITKEMLPGEPFEAAIIRVMRETDFR